ncbi:transcriptional regulator [Salmonella enterica subsp. enterica]|uniref:Transcriptional regulator n=1 Tax=Salmonella enterica I TaxID=59201 RepID=A0A3S4HHR5_SALET|nr:transcriptional regulator [Salmonella enterica subsp. enterica]
MVLLTGEYISERELPLAIAATPIKTEYSGEIQPLVDVEKEVILAALEKTGGNKTEAAANWALRAKRCWLNSAVSFAHAQWRASRCRYG